MTPDDRDETTAAAFAAGLQHTCNLFALHAAPRVQCLYFFILATSALVAGFGTARASGKRGAALGIALSGGAIALLFNLLDQRSKELVEAGEAAIREFEARMARQTSVEAIRLVDRVEKSRVSRSVSFSRAVDLFHGVALLTWLCAALLVWLRDVPEH